MSKNPYETQDIPVKAVAIGGLILVDACQSLAHQAINENSITVIIF